MTPARVLLIDPPWEYRNRHAMRSDNADKKTRFGIGVASRYSMGVMNERSLKSLGSAIRDICSPDCYVFMWAVRPSLDLALRLFQAWGLEYKTAPFTWVKVYPSGKMFKGTGGYNFSNPEDILLGRWPGSRLWHPNTGWKPEAVFVEPHPRDPLTRKIIHSRKPRVFHDVIHRWLSPYIGEFQFVELFSTQATPGWTCLGYDVTGNDIREDLRLYSESLPHHSPTLFTQEATR